MIEKTACYRVYIHIYGEREVCVAPRCRSRRLQLARTEEKEVVVDERREAGVCDRVRVCSEWKRWPRGQV